jgi:hypothetical protein
MPPSDKGQDGDTGRRQFPLTSCEVQAHNPNAIGLSEPDFEFD